MIKEYGDWKRGTIEVKSDKDNIIIRQGDEWVCIPVDFWKEIIRDFQLMKKK